MKWICRLSKRVIASDVFVSIDSTSGNNLTINDNFNFVNMYENFSFNGANKPNWVEFMLWDRMKDSFMPIMLGYKYEDGPENTEEAKRRIEYANG